MKISIVTLSFNQAGFLREAIQSLLDQKYPGLEYIVVDPGSGDGSREIVKSYGDGIAHAIFEKDKGASDGLNKGFEVASGDIFGFLNADDVLLPGSLARVAQAFRDYPEADMVMGNGYIIDQHGKTVRHVKARSFTVSRYFHSGTNWLQQSTFFRRDTYLRSPKFNLVNRTSWDGELFVEMVHQGARIRYIDEDLSGFRIYSSSITGSGTNRAPYLTDHARIFRNVYGRDFGWRDHLLQRCYQVEGVIARAIDGAMHRAAGSKAS